jgi:hypothetical protein
MAARTKDWFKEYGKRRRSNITAYGLSIDDESSDAGDATPVENLWGTNIVDSEPVQNAAGTGSYASGSYTTTNISSEANSNGEWGDFQGVDGDANGVRYADIPIRNIDAGSYQPASNIRGNGNRTTPTVKTRVSLIDRMAGSLKKPSIKPKAAIPRKLGGLLTALEVTKNRQKLIIVVLWTSENMDNAIIAISKGHKPVEIWSNITHDDAEIIVDAMLEAGQKSIYAAERVRQVINYYAYARLGTILGPRSYLTLVHLFVEGISLK